jgi:type I restriction enzyme R subunit
VGAVLHHRIAGANDGIVEKTARIQEDHVQVLKRDDGTTKNIYLIDKQNIHNNRLQVINQYEAEGAAHANRYDVTVLVNGLPMVHIELKRRGVDIREAFNQIDRYQRDSFWAGSGLFEYVQLFVISNGTLTKYYSNTVRDAIWRAAAGKRAQSPERPPTASSSRAGGPTRTTSPSPTWSGFTKTFFAKHTLLNILTRYCVFDVDRKLLVMRPYQIVATERILQRIETATNYKQWAPWRRAAISGTPPARQDPDQLQDRATGRASCRYRQGAVRRRPQGPRLPDHARVRPLREGRGQLQHLDAVLKRQLEDPNARIIITTIQKLPLHRREQGPRDLRRPCRDHLRRMPPLPVRRHAHGDHQGVQALPPVRLHRHADLRRQCRQRRQPAAAHHRAGVRRQAAHLHDRRRHHDKNVLPFRIDYINTIKMPERHHDKQVSAIDTEKALLAPERIAQIVGYIREHFDQKTKRSAQLQRSAASASAGFNSLFATASIDAAKRYYNQFASSSRTCRRTAAEDRADLQLRRQRGGKTTTCSTRRSSRPMGWPGSREFLEARDPGLQRPVRHQLRHLADKFQNYYKDLSQRLKNRELDLVIVVNMFLTGFDATTLNTLWVDKNLRAHGLIQAYSRTNRILNSVKTYGNIVSFRDLEQETNDAIALFGNKDAKGIVLLKPYAEYYDEYAEKVAELLAAVPARAADRRRGAQKEFIALFGAILRLRNILTSFDDFAGNEILTTARCRTTRAST